MANLGTNEKFKISIQFSSPSIQKSWKLSGDIGFSMRNYFIDFFKAITFHLAEISVSFIGINLKLLRCLLHTPF